MLKGKSEPLPAYRLLAARAAVRAAARDGLRRPRARAGAAGRGLGAGAGGAALRAGHDRRRRGSRQVAAGGRGAVCDRGAGRPRPLPALRGGDHLLAGRRGAEAARRDCRPIRPPRRRSARCLGESEAGTSAEEIAWAFRKLLEEQAPLVLVFDDIQWGEETFLDLVEHVVLLSSGAPLLVVCIARPELLERRPSWPVAVRLEPLGSEDAASLIGTAVAEELRARIAVRGRRQPALHRRDAGDGRGGGSGGRGAAELALAARRPPRPARHGRAAGARARRGRGRGLPPRRRAGARTGGDAGDAAPGRARPPGADPSRQGAVRSARTASASATC